MQLHPVIIIGGGPAGTSCATALQKQGISDVLILEAGDYSDFAIGENIPPTSKPLLQEIDVYDDFLAEGHLPSYGASSFWGDWRKGFNDTILSPLGNGWNLDRRRFNKFLARKAHEAGAKLLMNTRFISSERHNSGHVVSFRHKNEVYQAACPVLIDATGNKSVVAKHLGSIQIEDQSLLCIARRFRSNQEDRPKSQTIIESTKNGWWYAVGLPNDELLIAFYTLPELAKEQQVNELAFWESNFRETRISSEGFDISSPIQSKNIGFHTKSFCLDTCAGENWLAIGDAASCYDPITSRGIVKSLRDAQEAAHLVARYLNNQLDDFRGFDQTVRDNYSLYRLERLSHYRKEQRWPASPFWEHMHTAPATLNSLI